MMTPDSWLTQEYNVFIESKSVQPHLSGQAEWPFEGINLPQDQIEGMLSMPNTFNMLADVKKNH